MADVHVHVHGLGKGTLSRRSVCAARCEQMQYPGYYANADFVRWAEEKEAKACAPGHAHAHAHATCGPALLGAHTLDDVGPYAQAEEHMARVAEIRANHKGDEDPFFPWEKIEKKPSGAEA